MAKNPPTAYACVKCYKIIDKGHKIPFWKLRLNQTVSIILMIVVGLFGGLWLIKKWSEIFEAEIILRLKTAEYNISLTAGKAKTAKEIIKEDSLRNLEQDQ